MKVFLLSVVLCLLMPITFVAQSKEIKKDIKILNSHQFETIKFTNNKGSHTVPLIESNEISTIVEVDGYGESFNYSISVSNDESELSTFNVASSDNESFLGFSFPQIDSRKYRVTFYQDVFQYETESTDEILNYGRGKSLNEIESFIVDGSGWGVVALIVAACCIEAHYGSGGWDVGFDCDCLEIELVAGEYRESGVVKKKFKANRMNIAPVGVGELIPINGITYSGKGIKLMRIERKRR